MFYTPKLYELIFHIGLNCAILEEIYITALQSTKSNKLRKTPVTGIYGENSIQREQSIDANKNKSLHLFKLHNNDIYFFINYFYTKN